jgi:hypothetical protein
VRGRVGERADDLEQLDDRAGPAVRRLHRQGPDPRGAPPGLLDGVGISGGEPVGCVVGACGDACNSVTVALGTGAEADRVDRPGHNQPDRRRYGVRDPAIARLPGRDHRGHRGCARRGGNGRHGSAPRSSRHAAGTDRALGHLHPVARLPPRYSHAAVRADAGRRCALPRGRGAALGQPQGVGRDQSSSTGRAWSRPHSTT